MNSEGHQIARRAGTVGFFTLLSRIAGLIRDVSIASLFGTGLAADAFFVAFRIPNLFRRLFAEGSLSASFVPVFTETLAKSQKEARNLIDIVFSTLSLFLALFCLLGILLSPVLVPLLAPGFAKDPEKLRLTILLTRVMFPYLLLVSLAAMAMGILNTFRQFAIPAASPILMNLGIISGALVLTQWFDPPVLGLAVGVLLGGLLQLGLHLPSLRKISYWPRFRWDPYHPGFRKMLLMMGPAAYGAAAYQLNLLITTFLASLLPPGSISYLWYANRILEFPLGIFAISVATVILPTLSGHAVREDLKSLKESFLYGLRLVLFITLPAMGGLIVLSEPIVQLIYQHGTFDPSSTGATSQALVFFSLGLPFIAGARMTTSVYYSLQDTKTPVKVANFSILINLVLSVLLMFPLRHNGLALAVSLSSVFNFLAQFYLLRKKLGPFGRNGKGTFKNCPDARRPQTRDRGVRGCTPQGGGAAGNNADGRFLEVPLSFFGILLATGIMMIALTVLQSFLRTRLPGSLGLFSLIISGVLIYFGAGWILVARKEPGKYL